MRLTAADGALVAEAVAAAERDTDGEIATIVARSSDAYADAALHWRVMAMLLAPALMAAFPRAAAAVAAPIGGGWTAPTASSLLIATIVLQALLFLLVGALLRPRRLRLLLTPRATRTRRVRARARALFAVAAEQRTARRTGVLLYLSLDERRAEIVADAAIHGRVSPDAWGEAMAAMLPDLRAGRPGQGMAAAVAAIGAVLAAHFPRTEDDVNELPDRLIVL